MTSNLSLFNTYPPYDTGFLYADGYVRFTNGRSGELRLKLKRGDRNHIEKMKKSLKSTHPIKDIVSKVKVDGKIYESECSTFSVYNTKLVKDLEKHGCINNKTQNINIPYLKNELYRHFIRGYFDGDGYISQNNPKKYNSVDKYISKYYRIGITSNKIFISQLQVLFDEMYIKSSITNKANHSTLNIYNKESIYKIKRYFYDESTVFLERKKEIFDSINLIL